MQQHAVLYLNDAHLLLQELAGQRLCDRLLPQAQPRVLVAERAVRLRLAVHFLSRQALRVKLRVLVPMLVVNMDITRGIAVR